MNVIDWLMHKSAENASGRGPQRDIGEFGNEGNLNDQATAAFEMPQYQFDTAERIVYPVMDWAARKIDDSYDKDTAYDAEGKYYKGYTIKATPADQKSQANLQRYGNRKDDKGDSLLKDMTFDRATGDVIPRALDKYPAPVRRLMHKGVRQDLEKRLPASVQEKIPDRQSVDGDRAEYGKDYVHFPNGGARIWL